MNKEALHKLQKYCAYQERCHYEVEQKARSLGLYGTEVQEMVLELMRDNYLNEERFVEIYVRSKVSQKKWGSYKIKQELRKKKVVPKLIDKYLILYEGEIMEENASQLAIKFINERNFSTIDLNEKMKLKRFLQQKGYSQQIISDLINKIEKQPK